MKKYLIKSTYGYEIKAEDKDDAIEKYLLSIEEQLASSNRDLVGEFTESLVAIDIEPPQKDKEYEEAMNYPLETVRAIQKLLKLIDTGYYQAYFNDYAQDCPPSSFKPMTMVKDFLETRLIEIDKDGKL